MTPCHSYPPSFPIPHYALSHSLMSARYHHLLSCHGYRLCSTRFPCTFNKPHDMFNTHALLNLSENCRPTFPHSPCIPLHNTQISTDRLSQVCLINHQQITLRD